MFNLSISEQNREVFEIISFLKDNDFNVSDSLCRLIILQHEYMMKKALEQVAQEANVRVNIVKQNGTLGSVNVRTSSLLKGESKLKLSLPTPQ